MTWAISGSCYSAKCWDSRAASWKPFSKCSPKGVRGRALSSKEKLATYQKPRWIFVLRWMLGLGQLLQNFIKTVEESWTTYSTSSRHWIFKNIQGSVGMKRLCLHILLFFKLLYCCSITVSAFSPHLSTPPQPNPPPSPATTLPLGFVHVSFIVVPENPSPYYPFPLPSGYY